MCTLSFLPKDAGYIVAMNRDESVSRQPALPPDLRKYGRSKAIYPVDVEGGTWIAVSEAGTTWALLNRNATVPTNKLRSRGEIIVKALESSNESRAIEELDPRILAEVLPFRLIMLSAESQQVTEWVWDGENITRLSHPWRANHWFSSGISDQSASETRGRIFAQSSSHSDWGTVEWLRRMHRSHEPDPGAFSICVHRPDARSISYAEIVVAQDTITFSYSDGPPCEAKPPVQVTLPTLTNSRR
jgi:hypothetical protein